MNLQTTYAAKEVTDLVLSPNFDIQVGDTTISAGEPLVVFSSIQSLNINELRDVVSSKGGYMNRARVTWDTTKEISLEFSQGIFSQIHFALLANGKVGENEPVLVPKLEKLNADEEGLVTLMKEPVGTVFCYANGQPTLKLTGQGQTLTLEPFTYYQIYYEFAEEMATVIDLGKRGIKGFLTLTAKVQLKDEATGENSTMLLKLPKVELRTSLSARLGSDNPAMIARFALTAHPTGPRYDEFVGHVYFLDEEV